MSGISMDQIIANETGKQTQLASLELAIESSETAGACDTGFACPYTSTISWKSATRRCRRRIIRASCSSGCLAIAAPPTRRRLPGLASSEASSIR